jgi:hypothetical protein
MESHRIPLTSTRSNLDDPFHAFVRMASLFDL